MKRTSFVFGILTVVLAAKPAFAEAGLPQFDASLFPEQLFWLAITFSALYFTMRYLALPGVKRVQDMRKGVIDEALTAAKSANEQAKEMGHASTKALAEARAKANATITTIKTDASKVANDQQTAQSKQLQQRMRDAEAGIAATRDAALKEIEGSASDLAASIVENVSGMKVGA